MQLEDRLWYCLNRAFMAQFSFGARVSKKSRTTGRCSHIGLARSLGRGETMPTYKRPQIGDRFGRLVIQSFHVESPFRIANCICDCGASKNVKACLLRSGNTSSCGCLRRELASAMMKERPPSKTHGATCDRKQSAEYMIWGGMIQRCTNPKHQSYYRYGARGITVDQSWLSSFTTFLKDMGLRPSKLHTIERENNDLPYCASNCVWATRRVQSRNTVRSRWLTFNGETMVLADWAAKLGLSQPALIHRFSTGWTLERALSTPSMKGFIPCK